MRVMLANNACMWAIIFHHGHNHVNPYIEIAMAISTVHIGYDDYVDA